MRIRRWCAGLTGAAAGLALLTGCGAKTLPLAAVYQGVDGEPQALIRPCGDDVIQYMQLAGRQPEKPTSKPTPQDTGAPEAGEDEPNATPPNESGWRSRAKRSTGDVGFPLFEPPGDWDAEPVGEQSLLPELTYRLVFGKGEFNYEYTGIVEFRASDIEGLRPGHVWADGRAMPRDAFEELAEDSC